MNASRKLFKLVFVVLVAMVVLVGCESANYNESRGVNQQQEVYSQNQPVPHFDFSLERDVAIQLYQVRNEARNTWTVVTSQGTGAAVWMCPSIGYPLPYDTQLTNPESYYGTGVTLPQAEPNGLYTGGNSAGTWVLCVDDSGNVTPVYTELNTTAFPYPVEITDSGTIQRTGTEKPSVIIKINK